MLRRVGREENVEGAMVPIRDAAFPAPFRSGLEYSAPARGTWNIVHIGMLIPGAHEIFVCAGSCLRGVVLTAAEMGASDRFSTVTIQENNVLEGDMEELLIEGVSNVVRRLPSRPPAVLVYTSCIHHFMGCDLKRCYRELGQRFPDIQFTDCYMTPILRKSGLTPDQIMRRQLYTLWKPRAREERAINLIGNNLPTDESSDLVRLIRRAGWTLRDITLCKTYEQYQEMAASGYNISYNPVAKEGGRWLEENFRQKHLHLPLTCTPEKIDRAMETLAALLGVEWTERQALRQKAMDALDAAKKVIGDTAVVIDYTALPAPLSLCRLLLEHGFRVERLYVDAFNGAEEEEFQWLRDNAPGLEIFATVQVRLRVLSRETAEPVLAIGQKAAYFTGSHHFVNIVEGGGMYGYDGIRRLCELMIEAMETDRDPALFIQQKGLGCACCL